MRDDTGAKAPVKARPKTVTQTVTVPGMGQSQVEVSTADWDADQWAAYDISAEARRKTSSKPIAGTNRSVPLGVSRAVETAQNMSVKAPKGALPAVEAPQFPSEYGQSVLDKTLSGLESESNTASQQAAYRAQGLPSLSGGGVSEMGVGTSAVVNAAQIAAGPVYKPALAALQGWDWAWENIIAEPAATALLAFDENNPVYKDGFQAKDLWDTWGYAREASNSSSFGVAALSSPLTQAIPGLGLYFQVANELFEVDPFNPADVANARENYLAYQAITGATDLGLNLVPIPGGKGVGFLRRVTGLSNKVRAGDRAVIANDWELYKTWAASEGAEGYETNIGKQIMEIADSKDIGLILEKPLVKNQSGMSKGMLSELYARTDDPEMVFDIYQASIGDIGAMARLTEYAPDYSYALGRVGDAVKAKMAERAFQPTGEAAARKAAAFDSAVDREEWSRLLFKTFIDDKTQDFSVSGRWMPMEGKGRIIPRQVSQKIAGVVEDSRTANANMRAALKTGNADYIPGRYAPFIASKADEEMESAIAENIIQTISDGPVIRLLKIRPGSLQWTFANRPLNIVSFSASRPDDVIDEAYAMMNQIDGLRFGQSFPMVSRRPMEDGQFLNADGAVEMVEITAEEFRQQAIQRLTSAMAYGEGRVVAVWREIEDEIAIGMIRKAGIDEKRGRKIIEGFRNRMSDAYESARTNGFYYNEYDQKMQFDPKTIRQLADSEYTLPLNEIEAAIKSEAHHIVRRPAQYLGDGGREAFEFGSMLFRTNMLIKPGYTFRNSILEPWVTSVIAHAELLATPAGLNMMGTGLVNFGRNTIRRGQRVTVGPVDAIRNARLNRAHEAAAKEYNDLVRARDRLIAEIDDYGDTPPPSVAVKQAEAQDILNFVNARLDLVRRDLVDNGVASAAALEEGASLYKTSKMVRDMLDVAENPQSTAIDDLIIRADAALDADDVDLWEALESRIQVLQKIEQVALEGGDAKNDLIASLKNLKKDVRKAGKLTEWSGDTDYWTRVQAAQDNIDAALRKMRDIRTKQAPIKDRRERRAAPILQGEGRKTKRIRGQEVQFDEAFSGPTGSAYRADSSSAVSNVQSFNASAHNTTMLNIAMSRFRRGRTGIIHPDDPNYFEELHYTASRHFAGDPLFDRIATLPREEVIAWAKSPKGAEYFKSLGASGKQYLKGDHLEEAYRVYNTLFPTKEAQELLTSGREFTSGELQEAVLKAGPDGEPSVMSAIIGNEIDYVVPTSVFHQVANVYRRSLDKIWETIATNPESRMARWPYYVRQFEDEWTWRMESLADQGVEITTDLGTAQRRAAHRATLANLEKTFYNIRRYKNPVFTARFLMAFPGAYFNSIYRYAYFLPTRHPGNMGALMNVTNAAFGAISVDEKGHKSSFRDATYLVLPGTGKEPRKDDPLATTGVRIPVDALTRVFLDNPGRSWLVALSVDTLLNSMPKADSWMKDNLPEDVTKFLQSEYGPSSGNMIGVVGNSLLSGWQKTVLEAWQGYGSDEYKRDASWAWQQVMADRAYREENGEVLPPLNIEKDVLPVVDNWLKWRFLVQFASPTSFKVDAPGAMERDVWFNVREENPDLPYAEQKEIYYERMGGMWVDPYTASTSKDPYGIDYRYTVDAQEAIESEPDLAAKLGTADPELVGLLAVGTAGDFSKAVYNNMAFSTPYDAALSGPYRSKKTPEEMQADYNIQQGWAEYRQSKSQYVEVRKQAVSAGDKDYVKVLDDSWDFYLYNDDPEMGDLGLSVRNTDWYMKKNKYESGKTENIALALDMFRDDKSAYAKRKNDPNWVGVWEMVDARNEVIETARSLGSTKDDDDYKRLVKDSYIQYFNEKAEENPLLADLWERYFASEFEKE